MLENWNDEPVNETLTKRHNQWRKSRLDNLFLEAKTKQGKLVKGTL